MTEEAQSPKIYNSDLRLFDGINDYHVFNSPVMPGPDDKSMTLAGKSDAASFVERCMGYMRDDQLIRDYLNKLNIRCRNIYSTRELAASVADQIASTSLIVVPVTKVAKSGGYTRDSAEEIGPETEAFIPLPVHNEKIRFKFTDKTSGQSVKGVAAKIISSDGFYKESPSDRAGEITMLHLKPGVLTLSSEISGGWGATLENTLAVSENEITSIPGTAPLPVKSVEEDSYSRRARYYFAKITQHRVTDGETFAGIARDNNMTFKELAYFNWGTNNNEMALKCMRRDVGCRKLTDNSADYYFEDSNEPGILFIPEPVILENLQTDKTHIIKVSTLGYSMFHETFRLEIVDDEGEIQSKVACDIVHPDGREEVLYTNDEGCIELRGINAGKTTVNLVEYDANEITEGAK